MFKRSRAVALVAGSVLGTLAATGISAAPALAQTCPNHSKTTVSGHPSYTYVRGCIRSFDGTPIVYNLFEPLHPGRHSLYTIMEGPGWGSAGATTPDPRLISAHYAELTWDPRGFGQSGGVAEVDSPAAEGRDASALISKVLTGRPEIAVDRMGAGGQPRYSNDRRWSNTRGKPVVGMTGVSYGGGIEWSLASFDKRVKAIVPGWSWNDLDYSLDPGGVIKLGWGELLFGVGLGEQGSTHIPADVQGLPSGGTGGNQYGGYDPAIYQGEAEGLALGYWTRTTLAWFHQRSMAEFGAGSAGHVPDIPVLAEQGTVDTLFNLNDGWNNLVQTRAHYPGVPLKMIAFCGGHVSCPTGAAPTGQNYSDTASSSSPIAPGQSATTYDENAMLAWFNHYLRGQRGSLAALDRLVPAQDNLVWQAQNGNYYGTSTFPTPSRPGAARYVSAPLSGTLISHGLPDGGTGTPVGEDTAVTDGPTPAGDPGQVTVPVLTASSGALPIVGIGRVSGVVTVNGNATNLFFRLIDKNTGDVVDLQTAPLRFDNLDLVDNATGASVPKPQKFSLDLAGVSYILPKGDTLELQVSTSSNSYVPNRGVAQVTITGGTVSVPVL
ncbi:MAG TPA: CocE/NonD family hydrolase [Solirubrobacteraceae bacterium]|nr:CocE/NonD family hydrolase [Solirubrobacteraceae bacterium]